MGNGIFRAAGLQRALDEVARRLGEADAAAAAGDDERARLLRSEALRIATTGDAEAAAAAGTGATPGDADAGAFAGAGDGHAERRGNTVIARREPERTTSTTPDDGATPALRATVDRGHRLAKRPTLRRDDLRKLYGDKAEEKRVLALAILQKRPELASVELLREAVAGSRGAFEHAQGLAAAESAIGAHTLDAGEVAELREAIRTVLASGRLDGTDRAQAAGRILSE